MSRPFASSVSYPSSNPCFDDSTKTPCKDHTGTCREGCAKWAAYEKQHAKDVQERYKKRILASIGDDSTEYIKSQCRSHKKH